MQTEKAAEVDAFPSVEERNELFLCEGRHFLSVLSGGEESGCKLQDGIAVVRICEAIDRSAASGELTPIDHVLPLGTSSSHAEQGNGRAI